jgi:hypothetical protein
MTPMEGLYHACTGPVGLGAKGQGWYRLAGIAVGGGDVVGTGKEGTTYRAPTKKWSGQPR